MPTRIYLLSLVLMVQFIFAQQRAVNGVVYDDTGLPLPGVSVLVKETKTVTQTNLDGKFTIKASPSQTLVFSYIGMKTQEIKASKTTLSIKLIGDSVELEGVVVTAQGIKKEKKSLGYAITILKSESISQKAEGDIGRVLSGQIAGVNITASNGMSGSSTNIIIRGYSSISGSNQPLFIVDGVPFDSGTNTQSSYLDGNTESSRFLDLDPNSIESVSVLKGLSATVLYGSAGRNGVVLIKTKNSSSSNTIKKTEITISQSMFFSEAILPKYQNEYGGGFHQGYGYFYSNWGPRFDRTDNDGVANALQYNGTAENGNALLQHPYNYISDTSLITGNEDLLTKPYEYKAYNGVKDFFKTGVVSTTSVNAKGGNENINYNMSYGKTVDEGITRGNKLSRDNFGIGGNAILSNKFTITGVFNFSKTKYNSPPNAVSTGSGAAFNGSGVFADVMYTPRSVDLTNLPYQNSEGRSVYYRSGNDLQNPYWTVNNVKSTQDTDRFFGNAGIIYNINDWIKLSYRLGIDTYTELNSYSQNKGGISGDPTGLLRTTAVKNTIWNHTTNLNFNRPISENLNLSTNLGFQSQRKEFTRDGIESTGQLAYGILKHFNFANNSATNSFTGKPIAYQEDLNEIGTYLDLTLDYKNYLFFNVVARNDWYSTLEKQNNNLFYPGASVSFIPTTVFENLKGNILNYMKIRAGYGSSAGAPDPYNTRNSINISARTFITNNGSIIPTNTVNDRLGNTNLKPERIGEFEVGLDTRLFNCLNFNISAYSKETKDLITDQDLDDATGYTSTTVNIGDLKSQGIEIEYDIDIIKSKNNGLKFNIAGNFSANETTVTKLALGTDLIPLTDFISESAANYAVQGMPYGVLFGTTVVRDISGNKVVGNDGLYLVDKSNKYLGDPNPDWITSLIPTLSYKGITLSAILNYRHGGDIFSTTTAALIGRGVVDNGICRECTYILPGVTQTGEVNNIAITSTNLGVDTYFGEANEFSIFDGTTLRLQEVTLGYALSAKQLRKLPFGSLTFNVSGSNLWYNAFNFPKNINYDTNASSTGVGNGQGIDYITGPSSRRIGFSIKATF
ncbi:SusC/RagA family TonB-linked outer membrane protein [Flavobacterium sp. NG2]|uniref:SusC/RagA family TonB-linked outer membrane protein n=1 Tax=Flavobacterium sp. NG2 TaxID=3097547 RepID=UPI002A817596|nr:SusC/RagA family TonB-linked outer membrane protein [Flavobacterium sp. NG2]WPR71704.1 SusC/RagA family TonB-linked outer membrane protein [Flavobacterium sp. NG2]